MKRRKQSSKVKLYSDRSPPDWIGKKWRGKQWHLENKESTIVFMSNLHYARKLWTNHLRFNVGKINQITLSRPSKKPLLAFSFLLNDQTRAISLSPIKENSTRPFGFTSWWLIRLYVVKSCLIWLRFYYKIGFLVDRLF